MVRWAAVAVLVLACGGGCADPRERNGRIWYVDGVGNWGFGVTEMQHGFEAAGYRGVVDNFRWSLTLNPVIDQTFRVFARSGGQRLAGVVSDYLRREPQGEVNLVGLSAGTGVVIWCIEDLKPPHKVRNAILLGSSLSSTYDVSRALRNMTGEIIVYYSPTDSVLDGPCRVLGTIDGQFNDAAGLVGLKTGEKGRVRNIPWQPRFAALGWTGSHTDCTSEPFVRHELAQYVVSRPAPRGAQAVQAALNARR